MLAEFDPKYVIRKFVTWRAIAEFLANHRVKGDDAKEFLFSDKDLMTITQDTKRCIFIGPLIRRVAKLVLC